MSKRKSSWERTQQSKKKKKKENFLLTNTYKLISFFQVAEKEAGQSSDDLYRNSPPIFSQSNTVQDKIFSSDGNDDDDDIESSLTSDIQSSHPIQGVPNDVNLFGNITEKLREVCISIGIDHFRNKANTYPETKREYSGVKRFLNSSAFTYVLLNREVATHGWLVYSPSKTSVFCFQCISFSLVRSMKLCTSGDNGWKNINHTLKVHETNAKLID